MTSSAKTIKDLPPEILSHICSFLSRKNLKNLRLTSASFKLAAEPCLFATAYLKLHSRSFEHLYSISKHIVLSRLVKTIEYGIRWGHGLLEDLETFEQRLREEEAHVHDILHSGLEEATALDLSEDLYALEMNIFHKTY